MSSTDLRCSCLGICLIVLAACTSTRHSAIGPMQAPPADGAVAGANLTPRASLAAELVAPAHTAEAVEASAAPAVVEAVEAVVRVVPASAVQDQGEDLAVFRSSAFRRRFLESYLSETDIEPQITDDERETLAQAVALMSDDKIEEAAAALERARNQESSAALDFTLGNIYYQRDDLVRAEGAYLDAVAKFPNFRRAWNNLAQIHFRQGHFKAATGAFTKVVQLGGGDAITYGLLGVAHSRREEPIAAESAFRQAIMLDPDTVDWKLGLADSFFKQRRYPDAVVLFAKLIDAYPERADYWLAQGEAYARMGDTAKAAENFEVVDELGASTAAVLFNLADIYANEELFDLAVDSYVRALKKDAEASVARVIRAAKYLSANGALDAMSDLIAGIRAARGETLDTTEQKDLLKLEARLAVARGSGAEEAKVLEEIVRLDPLDGDALILLGQHSAREGNVEQAIFYYERAANIEAFEADAKVRHAQLLVKERRYEEAVPLLRRAQTVKPRDNIARYLEQVERVAKANRGRSDG